MHETQIELRLGISLLGSGFQRIQLGCYRQTRAAKIITEALSSSIPKYTDLIVILGLIGAMD